MHLTRSIRQSRCQDVQNTESDNIKMCVSFCMATGLLDSILCLKKCGDWNWHFNCVVAAAAKSAFFSTSHFIHFNFILFTTSINSEKRKVNLWKKGLRGDTTLTSESIFFIFAFYPFSFSFSIPFNDSIWMTGLTTMENTFLRTTDIDQLNQPFAWSMLSDWFSHFSFRLKIETRRREKRPSVKFSYTSSMKFIDAFNCFFINLVDRSFVQCFSSFF